MDDLPSIADSPPIMDGGMTHAGSSSAMEEGLAHVGLPPAMDGGLALVGLSSTMEDGPAPADSPPTMGDGLTHIGLPSTMGDGSAHVGLPHSVGVASANAALAHVGLAAVITAALTLLHGGGPYAIAEVPGTQPATSPPSMGAPTNQPSMGVPPRVTPYLSPSTLAVLFNADDPESTAWAFYYASRYGVPPSNMIGLHAPTDERLPSLQDAESFIFHPVREALRHRPWIVGILLGYHLPGMYGSGSWGIGGYSIACSLQDLNDEVVNVNPLCAHARGMSVLPSRITRSSMPQGHYIVARVDAPCMMVAFDILDRSWRISHSPHSAMNAYIWYDAFDSFLPGGRWPALEAAPLNEHLKDLPWMAFDEDTEATPADAFRFGTHDVDGWDDSRLRHPAKGPRILAYDLNSWGSTTVRDVHSGRFTPNAIDAGFASAIGSTAEPHSTIAPYPDTLLLGLRHGWTLGESFYMSNPYDDFTWELLGDPLMTVGTWSIVPADVDADGDVDLADYAVYQRCYNGPSMPPACPTGGGG